MISNLFSKLLKTTNVTPLCILLIFFCLNIQNASSENILIFTNAFATYSHRVSLEPLALGLADKGHNVTFFTPLKTKSKSRPHPNLTETCTKEMYETHIQFLKVVGMSSLHSRVNARYTPGMSNGSWFFDTVTKMCESTLKSKEVLDLFQRSKFDLIILDKATMSEVILGFAYKFNITKMIYYMGIGSLMAFEYDVLGISAETSWAPTWLSNYRTKELSFANRVHTEVSVLSWYFGYTQVYLPKIEKLIRDELKLEDMPPLQELDASQSLILLNAHYSDAFPRSLPPFVVQVGGMHLQESSGRLPDDLASFLSPEGSHRPSEFIYVSFGSYVLSSNLPPKFVKIFLDAFESLAPLKFMWKWESDPLKNIPKNVLLRKWFPQQDVLAHSNIRGFITQGGHMSLQQAIFNSVPVIILPVDGDQDYNAKRIRSAGNGIELEFFDLTVETLKEAISKLLTDKSYSQAASKLSAASKQRPMHPLDLAIWWIEFVLSQDDVSYLRPQTKNVTWWMTRSLDVWVFIVGVVITLVSFILTFLYRGVKILLKLCLKNGNPIEPKRKNL